MMLPFFSYAGKAIAWTALDSLWQWSILWLSYSLLIHAKGFEKPVTRYNLALLHYFTGGVLFILYLLAHLSGNLSFSLRSISFAEVGQIGPSEQLFPAINIFLGVIYLLTAAIRSSRIMVGLYHIRKMKSEGEPILETWISSLANEWQRKIGFPAPIRLWLSEKIDGPLTTGFLKPIIFFPFCAVMKLSRAELETLLLHELIHVKRHDYFINILVQLTQCLLFFNPFSDQFVRTIETERELAVDDMVIGSIHTPLLYATALLSVQQDYGRSQLTMNAATCEEQQLLIRIKRILKQPAGKAIFNPKPFFLPLVGGSLLWVMIAVPPQRILAAKTNTISKIEQGGISPIEGKRSTPANLIKITGAAPRLSAFTAMKKRSLSKGIRQSPIETTEGSAEEKVIPVTSKHPVSANTFSVKKEDRSFTYERNPTYNPGNPFPAPGEPFIPSNSFEKGKEELSRSASKNNLNAVAPRERMEQVRLLAVLWEKIQQASSREEKIRLTLLWRNEMGKRKNNTPVKIKKIVIL